jgi:hypothetical protein
MSWVITGSEKTPVDPQFTSVSLLLHGDGTNGSTTITDSSPTPKTLTAAGTAQISTTQKKFGSASISIPGSGSSVTSPTNEDFNLRSGDFTLETWVYVSSYPSNYVVIASYAQSTVSNTTNYSWSFGLRNNGTPYFDSSDNATAFVQILNGTASVLNETWSHIAVTRSGDTFRAFANGTLAATATKSGAMFLPSSSILRLGAIGSLLPFNGYIDDFRITKGVARYTANFTPPTAPFPDI